MSRWVIVMTAVVSSGAFVHWIRQQGARVRRGRARRAHPRRARRRRAGRAEPGQDRLPRPHVARAAHAAQRRARLHLDPPRPQGRAAHRPPGRVPRRRQLRRAPPHRPRRRRPRRRPGRGGQDRARAGAASPSGRPIDDCVRMVRERAARGGVTVARRRRPGLPVIEADGRKVRQALLNVVANAVRFTPAGRHRRDLGLAAGGDRCTSPCATPASASPLEDQERMFDRFEQAHATPAAPASASRWPAASSSSTAAPHRRQPPGGGRHLHHLAARPPARRARRTPHHLVAGPPGRRRGHQRALRGAHGARSTPTGSDRSPASAAPSASASAGLAVVLAVITPGAAGPAAIRASPSPPSRWWSPSCRLDRPPVGPRPGWTCICLVRHRRDQRPRLLQRQLRRPHAARLRLADLRRLRARGPATAGSSSSLMVGVGYAVVLRAHRRARLRGRPVDRRSSASSSSTD